METMNESEARNRDALLVASALEECAVALDRVMQAHGLTNDTLEGRTLMQSMGWAMRAANAITETFK